MYLAEPFTRLRPEPVQQFLFKGVCQFQQFLANIIGLTGGALPVLCCLQCLNQTVIIPAQLSHGRILKTPAEDAVTVTGKALNDAWFYLAHARSLDTHAGTV